MELKLYNLKPALGAKHKKKRIGRGDSSGHGTYSTRGAKGQKARSGGTGGLKLKGMKANILSIPKLGGFRSLVPKMSVVNLKDLERKFVNNDIITPGKLVGNNLVKSSKAGVKILGEGKLTNNLPIKGCAISASAKAAVAKAGGQVILRDQASQEKDEKK